MPLLHKVLYIFLYTLYHFSINNLLKSIKKAQKSLKTPAMASILPLIYSLMKQKSAIFAGVDNFYPRVISKGSKKGYGLNFYINIKQNKQKYTHLLH